MRLADTVFAKIGFFQFARAIFCSQEDYMKKTLQPRCYLVLLFTIFAAWGCESIAPQPRPDADRRRIERSPDGRESAKDEIIGTVEKINTSSNEIQLRTTEAKIIVIKFDPSTRVYSREREVGIEALRPSDLILARVAKTPGGERYADLIRLNDRTER